MPPTARAMGDSSIAIAGAAQAIPVTASPMSYQNTGQHVELIYVTIPTGVTASLAKGGVTLQSALTPAATTIPMGPIAVGPGQTLVLTYSAGAPTMTRDVV